MPAAVRMRTDFSAGELRRLAASTKNASQSRRLLSLAAILDGMSRAEAARIGGMDRQTLRDWVHRFNERGPDGLKDAWSKGNPESRAGPTRRDRSGSGCAWGRALAACRSAASHRRTLRRRLLRAHSRQDFTPARLQPHQRPAPPSGPGRAARDGVQKNFPATLNAHLAGLAKGEPVEI